MRDHCQHCLPRVAENVPGVESHRAGASKWLEEKPSQPEQGSHRVVGIREFQERRWNSGM